MLERCLRLSFENIKRMFYKKTIIISLVLFAFIIGYTSTLFSINESNLDTVFTADDYVLYFLNDFFIIGIFLNIVFIVFISGMFLDKLNYMYTSRIISSKKIGVSFIISIFISSIIFIVFTSLCIVVSASFLNDFSASWSQDAFLLIGESENFNSIKSYLSPLDCIIISITMCMIRFFIIGLIFYIGTCVFKIYYGGIVLNLGLILVEMIFYIFKGGFISKLFPSMNTLFTLYSVENKVYGTFSYSLVYIILLLSILVFISIKISKAYVK